MAMKEENERLQSCLKFRKEEQTKVNDASTKKDIQIARLENDLRDA
mgnify:CR=1 FL=1